MHFAGRGHDRKRTYRVLAVVWLRTFLTSISHRCVQGSFYRHTDMCMQTKLHFSVLFSSREHAGTTSDAFFSLAGIRARRDFSSGRHSSVRWNARKEGSMKSSERGIGSSQRDSRPRLLRGMRLGFKKAAKSVAEGNKKRSGITSSRHDRVISRESYK